MKTKKIEKLTTEKANKIVCKIFNKHKIDICEMYDCLSHSQKNTLTELLDEEGYFDNDDKIEMEINNKDPFNLSILNLFDKSYMLTKEEAQQILNITNKYKHFD